MSVLLSGCGTYVPAIQEAWEGTVSDNLSPGGMLQLRVKQKVYCSIVEAVVAIREKGPNPLAGRLGRPGHALSSSR